MTLLGALAGEAMGDPRAWGLDAAAAAAFVALVWPRLRGRGPIGTAALAMVLTLVSAPFVPTGVEVLIGATAALALGLPGRVRPDRRDDHPLGPVTRDAEALRAHEAGRQEEPS